jgi:prepilin-type N-terminal cleavage/methylation domain-containing protein
MGFALNLTKPFLWRFKLKLFMKSNGFTLIEILVSIVILSISLLALAGLMATTTRNTSFGGHITEAATYAQDQLEQLRVTSWGNIANNWVDASGLPTRTGPSGITYGRTLNVVTSGNIKTVTITINWTDQTAHSFSLISVIVNPIA